MQSVIENLIEVLERSATLYGELAAILEQEPPVVVDGDLTALERLSAEKERLLSRLTELGRSQEGLRRRIARHYAVPFGTTLAQLAQRLPGNLGQRLAQIGEGLRAALHRVRQLNGESRLLIQHRLKMIHNSLSFLTHWSAATPLYAPSGSMDNKVYEGCLVSSKA